MAKYKKNKVEKPTVTVVTKDSVRPASARSSVTLEGPLLLEQQRAQYALAQIQAAVLRPQEGKYKHSQIKSFTRRFPGMVQANGFGQAAAFFYSKRNDYPAYGVIYELVEGWLCQEGQVYADFAQHESPKLLKAITQSDQYAYRQATAETQALMIWVKKFAQGLILSDEGAD